MAPYLASLAQIGFDDFQLVNAQGNRFDRVAIAFRLRSGVAAWLRGDALQWHDFIAPPAVLATRDALRANVVSAGLPACPSPFPADLRGASLHGISLAPAADTDVAAEYGRGGH